METVRILRINDPIFYFLVKKTNKQTNTIFVSIDFYFFMFIISNYLFCFDSNNLLEYGFVESDIPIVLGIFNLMCSCSYRNT